MPINVFDLAGIDFGLPAGLGVSLARRAAPYQSQQEQESLLSSVLNGTVGGIATAANLLDTIGGPLRNLAAGRFEDILPSIFDPSRRISGRQVGEDWGLFNQNNEGFHPIDDPADAFQDVLGLGLEVGLDPLTYMTFGGSALGKAGKLAKKAGLLEDLARVAPKLGSREARLSTTLDDLLRPRLGDTAAEIASRSTRAADAAAAMGINLSDLGADRLGGLVGTPFGAMFNGPGAQNVARGLDTLGSGLRYGNIPGTNVSPGRMLGSMFSAPALGAESRFGQETLMPAIFKARQEGRVEARGAVAEAAGHLQRAPEAFKEDTLDAYRLQRRIAEGIENPTDPHVADWAGVMRSTNDDLIQQAEEWGTRVALKDPKAKYATRLLSGKADKAPEGELGRMISRGDRSALSRQEYAVGVEGGTDTLMRIALDPETQRIRQLPLTLAERAAEVEKHIRANYAEIPAEYAPRKLQKGLPNGAPPVLADRFGPISKWYAKMPLENLKQGIYGNAPTADFAVGTIGGIDKLESTKVVLKTLGDTNLVKKMWEQSATPGTGKPLSIVLKELKLNRKAALGKIAELRGNPGAGMKELKALGKELVPADLAADLTRYQEAFSGPKAVGEMVKLLDNFNAYFKTGVTTVFPAFHARNLVSGAFNNLLKGNFRYQDNLTAGKILRGESADLKDVPIVKRMMTERDLPHTPENSVDMIRELAYAHETAGGHFDRTATTHTFESLTDQFPGGYGGSNPTKIGESLAKGIGRGEGVNLNPFDIRGVGGRTKSGFGPAALGEDTAEFTEGINRLGGLIAGLRKGKAPGQVMREVNAAQVAYSARNFTATEQQVMARLFPFYKYARAAMPFMLTELTERPGGRLAQFLRAQNSARGTEPGTPDYVRETASIKLGEQGGGTDRYLTGLGLGYEDPLSFFGGGLRGGLIEGASRLNPLAKAPLEWLTHQSFFQKGPGGGREIDDLDPTLGRLGANLLYQIGARSDPQGEPVQVLGNRTASQGLEFIASNSPLSKLFSTARTVTDPRKFSARDVKVDPFGLLNVTTGVRIADISPAAQDRVIQERANALMQEMGAKVFTETYFPADAQAAMDPEDQQKAVEFQMLQKLLDQRRKERRQAKQMAAGGI